MELEVQGRRIAIATVGASGPAVVLAHSSGLSGRQFRQIAEDLGRDHRVFLPDLIGYGKNDLWQGTAFDPSEDEQVLLATAAAAGPPVVLGGHSYGGWLALRAAQKVETTALVLMEPVAFGVLYEPPDAVLSDLAALDAYGDFFAPSLIGSPQWCERFTDWWGGPGAWARMGPIMQGLFVQRAVKTFCEVRGVAHDRAPISSYRAGPPALLVRGELTRAAAARVAELLATHLRGTLETIAGAGHMAPLSHADEVSRRVVAFVRRHPAGGDLKGSAP